LNFFLHSQATIVAKCLCLPPLVGNWPRSCWGAWVSRQALRYCAFTVNPYRAVSPSAGHWPGWQ